MSFRGWSATKLNKRFASGLSVTIRREPTTFNGETSMRDVERVFLSKSGHAVRASDVYSRGGWGVTEKWRPGDELPEDLRLLFFKAFGSRVTNGPH